MVTVHAIFDWAIFIVPRFWEDSIVPSVFFKLLSTGNFSFALSCGENHCAKGTVNAIFDEDIFSVPFFWENSIVPSVPLTLILTEPFFFLGGGG